MFFCTIALATWFGSLRVADGTYSGGCWAAALHSLETLFCTCCAAHAVQYPQYPAYVSPAGGEVLSILMASMLGGFALGQASCDGVLAHVWLQRSVL